MCSEAEMLVTLALSEACNYYYYYYYLFIYLFIKNCLLILWIDNDCFVQLCAPW